MDLKKLAYSGIEEKLIRLTLKADGRQVHATDWLNFKALGCKGDPIIYGGRFKKLPPGRKNASQRNRKVNLSDFVSLMRVHYGSRKTGKT